MSVFPTINFYYQIDTLTLYWYFHITNSVFHLRKYHSLLGLGIIFHVHLLHLTMFLIETLKSQAFEKLQNYVTEAISDSLNQCDFNLRGRELIFYFFK